MNLSQDIKAADGLFIDTNVLLIAAIGDCFNKLDICKRLSQYNMEDYHKVKSMLSLAKKLYVLPNVTTEVSNLSNSLNDRHRKEFYTYFSKWISVYCEEYQPTSNIKGDPDIRLGVTDVCILMSFVELDLVYITADFDLYMALSRRNKTVYNYAHIQVL